MAASGGFSFGGAAGLSTSKPTGITFGTPSATTSAAGLTFGAAGTPAPAAGFSLGGAKTTGGFSLGGPGTTSTAAAGGGLLGTATAAPATTTAGSLALSLGLKRTTATAAPATGLSFGASTTAKPGGLFGATPAAAASGLTLGGASTSGGLSLGLQNGTKAVAGGLSLGGLGGATSAGLGLGLGLGLGAGAAPATTSAVSKGLGGVDPSSLLAASSATGLASTTASGTSDNKAIKETQLHPKISETVESFKKYFKKQKALREEITRFSVKPYHRVREEITALRQLLALVSNGLQRNAVAIHQLRQESAQELKNAEVAHRTQEIPPALQLENYTPTEYFQRLTEQFEKQMHLCRQQIEQMESFMAALAQPNIYTPQELATILVKLNETFIALAAQLQSVHEAVRAQKDQYLNYRRVYHGDADNVFAVQKKASDREQGLASLPMGPQAFDNVSNAAAIAMATALQSAQKPAGIQGAGLTGPFQGGLGGASSLGGGGGFGAGSLGLGGLGGTATAPGAATGSLSLGGFGFGGQAAGGTAVAGPAATGLAGQPTGFGTAAAAAGNTSFGFGTTKPTATAASFGGSLSAGPTIGGSTGFGFGAGTGGFGANNFGSTTTGKPFQLQKPPSKQRKGTRY